MFIISDSLPEELREGIAAIVEDFPNRFSQGLRLSFQHDESLRAGSHSVSSNESEVTVRYGGKIGAFRALGRLMGAQEADGDQTFSETASFDMLGIMLDCSRNAVMNLPEVKNYLRRCALMGINTVMLYTEDTYEVPSEPFFGYLRGGYTQDELKQIDTYADSLGIEMFPCIQTLGHMEQFLQWDAGWKYRDTSHVMCAGDDDVYDLLERIIEASSSCFRSNRVHVGMDEAHGLGSGEYRKKFGETPPFEIMNKHLERVRDICKNKGLVPMIWSDMYFRLGSATNSYYEENWQISDDVIAGIPKDVQLVYWDYYHVTKEHYQKFIEHHRRLGSDPVVGGGVWTWGRLWCGLPYSIRATDALMSACRESGLKETFMTMWGDDGAECDYTSALPGLQHFAELAYADEVDPDLRAANLLGSCGMVFDDWMESSKIDTNDFFGDTDGGPSSASKPLLWQDPALPLYDANVRDLPIGESYGALAEDLFAASEKSAAAGVLRHPALIAKTISLKTGLRNKLAEAYKENDVAKARALLDGDLTELKSTTKELWELHRDSWMRRNKPFGWEVLEGRYGTLLARLDTFAYRVGQWCDGKVDRLEELEVELLNAWPEVKGRLPGGQHGRIKTASFIK